MSGPKTPNFSTLTVSADDPQPASRHGAIEPVRDDVYMVRGRMPSTPKRPLFERWFLHYSRTMTIVRRLVAGRYQLTLFNTQRLNDQGLHDLEQLGKIEHVVRLGSFHGVDDAFYINRFGATYWTVSGMENAIGLNVVPEVMSSTHLPLADATYFEFRMLKYPEAIMVLQETKARSGVAITTDAIQNHRSAFDRDNSLLVSFAIRRIGLLGTARLGPVWMQSQLHSRDQGVQLSEIEQAQRLGKFFRPQYERLLAEHDFDMLMPGHGWPLRQDAKNAIRASLDSQLAVTGD